MQLSVPEPTATDAEVVATALETAGIFGVQGDYKEALRWIRRAAEAAGDAGDDDRALSLARAAADLTVQVREADGASTQLAQPNVAPAVASTPPAASDALGTLLGAPPPPPPPPPPQPPGRAASTPPQQPARISVSPIVALAQGPTTESAAPAIQQPPHVPVNPPTAPLFGVEAPRYIPPAEAAPEPSEPENPPTVRRPPPAPEELAAMARDSAETDWQPPPPPSPTRHVTPVTSMDQSLQAARALQSVEDENDWASPAEPVAAPEKPQSAKARSSFHQSVRASVQASVEPGVFILRVLNDGENPAEGCAEALVVLTDPAANMFS